MYRGYFKLGGVEIVNSERTSAYVFNNLPGFGLKDCNDCSTLHLALGDQPYESPIVDDAPWADPSDPSTYRFYGFYPLELSGTLDSTRTANVIESVDDGGYIGSPRAATREMRYRGLLVAADRLALHAGMSWLKAALHPAPCGEHGGSCTGATACLYAACPEVIECYEDDPSVTAELAVGSVTPTTPFSYTFPDADGLYSAHFEILPTDGAVVAWSGQEIGAEKFVDLGPIISKRTNSVPNPSFTTSLATWTFSGGNLIRTANGGADSGGYGFFDATGPGSVRTPDLAGWFGPVTASFALRGLPGSSITAAVVTADGGVVAVGTYELTAEWKRHYLHAGFGRNVFLTLQTAGADFQFDQVMLEAGTLELPYFDGSSPAADPLPYTLPHEKHPGHYVNSWTATSDQSPSTQLWVSNSPIVPTTPGAQVMDIGEGCRQQWIATLEVRSGAISSGLLVADLRAEITPYEQTLKYERNFHDVTVTAGPTVVNEYSFLSGEAIEVEWTMVAATPFAYGATDDLLVQQSMATVPTTPFDDDTLVCPVVTFAPILDPDCPPVPIPPRPPAVPNICIEDTTDWDRYSFMIDGSHVSGWQQMLPTITLNTRAQDVRQVRVRMTPNPFGWPVEKVDPCSWCSEFILSYLPANAELTVDALTSTAYASIAGAGAQPASHLLYGTDGTPMSWPSLSCGMPYVMTVDVPVGTNPDVLVSLSLTKRES